MKNNIKLKGVNKEIFDFINDYLRFFKGGLFHMLSANIVNKTIGMVCNMLITRIMSTGEYGIWSYTLNIYSYLLLITGLGLYSGALQFGAENVHTEKEYSIFCYALKKGILIDTIIVVVFLLGSFFISFSIPDSINYIRVYVPILIFEYILNLFYLVLRCEDRIKEYAIQLNINSIITAIGICGGAFWGVFGLIIGRYLSTIISIVLVLYKIFPIIKKMLKSLPLSKLDIHDLWKYSLSIGFSGILNGAMFLIDVTMIAIFMSNADDVAYYKVATLIPNALVFIPQSVVVSILTKIVYHRNDLLWLRKILKNTYFGLGVFNILVCFVLFIFAPFIITFISGDKYLPSVPPFRVLVCGYFISGTFRTLSTNTLAALRKISINVIISIFAIVLDIVLNIILITRFSAIGAAYATFCVEVLTAFMGFLSLCLYFCKSKIISK